MALLIGVGCAFKGAEMRDFDLLKLWHGSDEAVVLYDGLFHVFELEQGGVLHLVDLNGVVLDLPQLEKGILAKRMRTFTISLLILAR